MVKLFFWVEEGEGVPVNLSLRVKNLLDARANCTGKRPADILREVFQLYDRVTEVDLINYLNLPFVKPS